MTETRTQLPATSVPIEGYELIKSFANTKSISISEAVRQLLKESPRLIEYAKEKSFDVEALDVNAWGGPRSTGSPQNTRLDKALDILSEAWEEHEAYLGRGVDDENVYGRIIGKVGRALRPIDDPELRRLAQVVTPYFVENYKDTNRNAMDRSMERIKEMQRAG